MSEGHAIIELRTEENQMVSIEKLIELGVLRKSMFSNLDNEWYVIYTEKGVMDISLQDLLAE